MRRYVLIFGSIGGSVLVLIMFLTMPFFDETIDLDSAQWLGYVSMIVALSTVFVGIKSYRDKELAGRIGFGNAFRAGLLTALVASVFYVAGWMIYVYTLDTDFMDVYHRQSIEKVKISGDSETEIKAQIADMEAFRELYKNPLVQIGVTFLEIFPVGLLVALISAGILKRDAPMGDQSTKT